MVDVIGKDFHLLPRSGIDPVVLYYRQANVIETMIDDLRSEAFTSLDRGRRARMFTAYAALTEHSLRLADDALVALNRALGDVSQ